MNFGFLRGQSEAYLSISAAGAALTLVLFLIETERCDVLFNMVSNTITTKLILHYTCNHITFAEELSVNDSVFVGLSIFYSTRSKSRIFVYTLRYFGLRAM